jgi:hypothetical protein
MWITDVIRPGPAGLVVPGLPPAVGGRVVGAFTLECCDVVPSLGFSVSLGVATVEGGFCAWIATATVRLNTVSSGSCTLDISTANCY